MSVTFRVHKRILSLHSFYFAKAAAQNITKESKLKQRI